MCLKMISRKREIVILLYLTKNHKNNISFKPCVALFQIPV